MATWKRIAVAVTYTVGLMVGAMLYNEVFINSLLPLVEQNGPFSTPVFWMEDIVPAVLLIILVAAWGWVIAGAVTSERTVNKRVRR